MAIPGTPTRRAFLKGSAAAAGAVGLASHPLAFALAETFPSRNINVYVPTREGGGADRNLRAFTSVWKKYLKVNFENAYFPGAAGRVGYEKYMGLAKPDCYDLLFGNMGPEVLNWVVKQPSFDLNDYFYFARVDEDPGVLFVNRDGPFKTIDDIVAEGKKRTLNVAVSRLAHPASLGALALAKHTGAQFNLIPLSGGRNTMAGVATKEADLGALPSGGVISRGKNFRIALMFTHDNPVPDRTDNAPTINAHFGTNLPSLVAGSRAFAIKREAVQNHPDRYKILTDTLKEVFTDPEYKVAVEKTKAPWELIKYGSPEACAQQAKDLMVLGEEYKALLTGKS
ncbi:MAG: tripartite tricarboxylate transporter substrate-binding protein [Rhodospirillales bacterium]|nr:tripartite tricarboxylate transporter substrate-binding protein [Rhodospirillales bacterium]MDH3917877.1 tripartite tricarboxylate transporter substrate-binding protein [Rhodospirillales bacterium]